MPGEFKKIPKAEVEAAQDEAKSSGRYLGRNQDAARLFDFIAAAGGFDGHNSTKGISQLAYEYAASEKQQYHERSEATEERDYGYRRWENLRRGGKHFTPREAEFVHFSLVKAAGYEWGKLSALLNLPAFHLTNSC